MWTLKAVLGGLLLSVLGPMCLVAQDASRVNIYRYALGIDIPESPALVALGLAPTHVLRGSAPKPIAASLVFASGDLSAPGVAIDVVPYFLVGGGVRRLGNYRSKSIKGRLTRVITKTLLSFGVVRDPGDPSSLLLGVGVRPTFHDPHDPMMTHTALPDSIAEILKRRGVTEVETTVEDIMETYGVDLSPVFARARSNVRGLSGDAQVSAGWGLAGRVQSGILASDSLVGFRHTLWIAGQFTTGPRFDVLATVQVRNAFHSEKAYWIGAGIERKTTNVDFRAEVYFDTMGNDLHPGVAVDARLLPHLRLVTSLTTSAMSSGGVAEASPRRLEFRTVLRLFAASDH